MTDARNEVILVGRVAAAAQERVLPSGDTLVTWRLVVDRPEPTRPAPPGLRLPRVDTIECVSWPGAGQRSSRTFAPGDVVAVEGALRRRFWRAGPAAVSRYEVEVLRARRVRRAQQSR